MDFTGRRGVCAFLLSVCLGASSDLIQAKEEPSVVSPNARAIVDAAIAKMRPSLVRIHVVSTEYHEGREMKNQAVGSGAIITRDGYLVTNHHVAGHGERMVCTLWSHEEIDADLVGTDPLTDISVLKLRPEKPRDFEAASFGDSALMAVGDSVLAMGSPMALSQSVTLGIISNNEMVMPRMFGSGGHMRLDGEDVGALVKWLAHDAAIYGGNSGGPLVNLKGEIVGINEIRFGLSGAIPGNLARRIAEQLIAHKKIQRSWLGVDVQPLFKHSNGERGVLVSGVIADSPAARAGLQAGDMLIQVNKTEVSVKYDEEMPDFTGLITSLPIGRDVPATILRGGKKQEIVFRPIERGELNPKQHELKQWGLTVRNLSFLVAREMKRTNTVGVLITSVRPGGAAGEAKPPLQSQDVLIEVDGKPVNSAEELMTLTQRITEEKNEPRPILATFERDSRRFLTLVRVGIEEMRDPGLEVSKAWLPVETHVISRDVARHLGKPELKGFYITQVYPNSTAEKAGLQPGDFITAVDDEKLTASGAEHEDELAALIRQYDIGARVQLTVLRKQAKDPLKVPVELSRSPKLRREMKKYRNDDFEFTVRDIGFFDIAEEQWKLNQRGVLVEDVKPGSWAELGSLSADDLLIEVDGHPVPDVEALKPIMEGIAADKKTFVVMKVLRGIHTAFLELEPTWKK